MPDLTPPPGYLEFFRDDFDYVGAPDPAKWIVDDFFEDFFSQCDPTLATVDGSKLILRAEATNTSNRRASSVRCADAGISWMGSHALNRMLPSPCWLEFRAKTSIVAGVWSYGILWSQTRLTSPTDTAAGEIDVCEARGGIPTVIGMHSHITVRLSGVPTNFSSFGDPAVTPGQSHQFVAHYSRNSVRLYLDGVLTNERDMTSDPHLVFQWPYTLHFMCFIVPDGNLPETTVYPVDTQMEVEYVRAYTAGQYGG